MRLALVVGAVVTVAACGGSGSTVMPGADGGTEAGTEAGADASSSSIADPNTGTCQYSCDTKADCCTDCTYPANSECVDHRCVWQGCSGDADCQRPTTGLPSGPGVVCRAIQGVHRCVRSCAKDEECTAASPYEACNATDDAGELYCGPQRFGGINPCGNGPECWACKSDGDCDGKHGVGTGACSPVTHTCGCSVDTQCATHWVCDHTVTRP